MAYLDTLTNWAGSYDLNSTVLRATTEGIIYSSPSSSLLIESIGTSSAAWKVTLTRASDNSRTRQTVFIALALSNPDGTRYLSVNNVPNLGKGTITADTICNSKVYRATFLIYLLDVSNPNRSSTTISQAYISLKN